jgi:threonine synthase
VKYQREAPTVTARAEVRRGHGMWRFRPFMPLLPGEQPVTLGEGDTPLLHLPRTGAGLGLPDLWLKDEGVNPTGSFKARGLSAAMTRAVAAGATQFVIPTAGNAGVALSAYASRAGCGRGCSPADHAARDPGTGEGVRRRARAGDGHIGDAGRRQQRGGRRKARTTSPPCANRIASRKKTLAFDLAVQFGWTMPDAIIYPTGGGTGLIGMVRPSPSCSRQGG